MSVKKTILLLCIILYSADQASSLKCYQCDSINDEDCHKNPKQTKFEFTCSDSRNINFASGSPNIASSTLLSVLENFSTERGSTVSYALDVYDCAKASYTRSGGTGVGRACILKSISDELYKEDAKKRGFVIDSISRCDTDLCNSSSTLNVGLLTLMSSFFFIFFIKL